MAYLHQVCVLICFASAHTDMRVVDLTHAHGTHSVAWPGNPDYNFTILQRGRDTQGGYWFEMNYFGTGEHSGTHVDAPAHFNEGGWKAHQVPMDKLIGPGVVINVTDKATQNPDYRVTVADLLEWEAKHATRIPRGAIVLLNTGWSSKYPNITLVMGTDIPTDTTSYHFPGYHEEAADWLTRFRNVHVVGTDTPSVDYGQTTSNKVHIILSRAGIVNAEQVANVEKLPEIGAMVYVGSLKLFDGSGGPARIFATYYEHVEDTAYAPHCHRYP